MRSFFGLAWQWYSNSNCAYGVMMASCCRYCLGERDAGGVQRTAAFLCCVFRFVLGHHVYVPAQIASCCTLGDLLDKPWSQVLVGVFPSPPRYKHAFAFIARGIHSHCSSIFIEFWQLTLSRLARKTKPKVVTKVVTAGTRLSAVQPGWRICARDPLGNVG